MICDSCGTKYRRDDAVSEFETRQSGLSYAMEIDNALCGDCAVDFMEDKIRSQPGYRDAYADEDGDLPPWP